MPAAAASTSTSKSKKPSFFRWSATHNAVNPRTTTLEPDAKTAALTAYDCNWEQLHERPILNCVYSFGGQCHHYLLTHSAASASCTAKLALMSGILDNLSTRVNPRSTSQHVLLGAQHPHEPDQHVELLAERIGKTAVSAVAVTATPNYELGTLSFTGLQAIYGCTQLDELVSTRITDEAANAAFEQLDNDWLHEHMPTLNDDSDVCAALTWTMLRVRALYIYCKHSNGHEARVHLGAFAAFAPVTHAVDVFGAHLVYIGLHRFALDVVRAVSLLPLELYWSEFVYTFALRTGRSIRYGYDTHTRDHDDLQTLPDAKWLQKCALEKLQRERIQRARRTADDATEVVLPVSDEEEEDADARQSQEEPIAPLPVPALAQLTPDTMNEDEAAEYYYAAHTPASIAPTGAADTQYTLNTAQKRANASKDFGQKLADLVREKKQWNDANVQAALPLTAEDCGGGSHPELDLLKATVGFCTAADALRADGAAQYARALSEYTKQLNAIASWHCPRKEHDLVIDCLNERDVSNSPSTSTSASSKQRQHDPAALRVQLVDRRTGDVSQTLRNACPRLRDARLQFFIKSMYCWATTPAASQVRTKARSLKYSTRIDALLNHVRDAPRPPQSPSRSRINIEPATSDIFEIEQHLNAEAPIQQVVNVAVPASPTPVTQNIDIAETSSGRSKRPSTNEEVPPANKSMPAKSKDDAPPAKKSKHAKAKRDAPPAKKALASSSKAAEETQPTTHRYKLRSQNAPDTQPSSSH